MNMKIEKSIPIPPHTSQKYPFPEMSIGDSFAVEWDARHKARQAAFYFKQKNKKFEFRTARMNGKLRIWRTK